MRPSLFVSLALFLSACSGGDTSDDSGSPSDSGAPTDTDTDVAPEASALALGATQPTALFEEDTFTLTVHIVDAAGSIAESATNEVTLLGASGSISGTGTLAGTLTQAAVGGVATFDDLSWPHAETLTLDVSATDLTGLDDASLELAAKPFTKLVVTQPDSNANPDVTDPVAAAEGFVAVFDIAAEGDAAPLNTFTGTSNDWIYAYGLGFDEATGEVLVAHLDANVVARYPLDATGSVAATSVVAPTSTTMSAPARATIDPYRDELYIPTEGDNKLYVFERDAVGDATPLRVLGGDLSFGESGVTSVAIDYGNDEIFVCGSASESVYVFNRTDDGDVAPKREITGGNTGIDGCTSIIVIPKHDEFIVTVDGGNVLFFSLSADGDATPTRKLGGTSTGLRDATGVAWNPATDEIFVAEEKNAAIHVFNRTDSGDVAPKRSISGNNTVFSEPSHIILAR